MPTNNEIIRKYTDENGKIEAWPSKRSRQIIIIDYLAELFDSSVVYSHKEMTDMLNKFHTFNDPALLRRELCELKLFDRTKDGTKYWKI